MSRDETKLRKEEMRVKDGKVLKSSVFNMAHLRCILEIPKRYSPGDGRKSRLSATVWESLSYR